MKDVKHMDPIFVGTIIILFVIALGEIFGLIFLASHKKTGGEAKGKIREIPYPAPEKNELYTSRPLSMPKIYIIIKYLTIIAYLAEWGSSILIPFVEVKFYSVGYNPYPINWNSAWLILLIIYIVSTITWISGQFLLTRKYYSNLFSFLLWLNFLWTGLVFMIGFLDVGFIGE